MQPTVPRQRANPRYETLLSERIERGRDLVDALCHPDRHEVTLTVWRNVQRLERELQRFRRYNADYLARVAPVEDARFHEPMASPADPPCTWCLHGALDLHPAVVLMPATRRPA